MAFPSIRSRANTNGTVADATATLNLPGTIVAGDTILVQFRCAVAGAVSWPDASWTELVDASPDAADDQVSIAWRRATGDEGATITLAANGNGKFCAIAWAVRDAADPHVTPPEISTVATGTTPNEPNATTCTPTGGAKDYLWLTVFSMEGEQTGITAYPANYTIEQTGLANSGTGGAVTTNCTMAGAAQQLNAASEDAGVWDVTGTLDDWSAYTIAFHPPPPDPTPGAPKVLPSPIVRAAARAVVSVLAFVPLVTAEEIPSVAAWPQPPPIIRQPVRVSSSYAFPLSDLPGGPADGLPDLSTGALSSPPTIQYGSLAGPVVFGPELSWLATPPPIIRSLVVSRSYGAAPLLVEEQAPSIGWWPWVAPPTRTIRAVPSFLAMPVIETSGAAPELAWWPQFPDRLVRPIPFVRPYTADAPVAPTLPTGADALATISQGAIRPPPSIQYTALAGPVVVPPPGAVPEIPSNVIDSGSGYAEFAIQTIAMAGPVAIPQTTGWWTQPPRVILTLRRVVESRMVEPLLPQDPSALSTLPWIPRGLPLVRFVPNAPSFLAWARIPDEVSIGWLARIPEPTKVITTAPSFLAVPIQPLDADALSTLPWLVRGLPLVRLPIAAPSFSAWVPLDIPAEPTVSWLVTLPQRVPIQRTTFSVLVVPLLPPTAPPGAPASYTLVGSAVTSYTLRGSAVTSTTLEGSAVVSYTPRGSVGTDD